LNADGTCGFRTLYISEKKIVGTQPVPAASRIKKFKNFWDAVCNCASTMVVDFDESVTYHSEFVPNRSTLWLAENYT
jgi:hypothetical protein